MISRSPSLQISGSYRAYLVRMWQEHSLAPWRLSVHDVQTGEKRTFSDLGQLMAFLKAQTQGETNTLSSSEAEE